MSQSARSVNHVIISLALPYIKNIEKKNYTHESKQPYDYDNIFSVYLLCSTWYFYNNKGYIFQNLDLYII